MKDHDLTPPADQPELEPMAVPKLELESKKTESDPSAFLNTWEPLPEANSQHFERRRQDRKKPPKAAATVQFQRCLNAIVYKVHGSRAYQILFVVLTMMGIGLIWFSATHRIELIDTTYRDFGTRGELETQILQLKEIWSEEAKMELAAGLENAEKRTTFNDYRSLAIWLKSHGEQANSLNLNFTYSLGSGQKSPIEGMVEVPVQIELIPEQIEPEQVYVQVVEFLRGMVTTAWHVDIQDAAIRTESNELLVTTVQLRVWVQARVKTDD